MEGKICTKCKQWKSINDFGKCKTFKDGLKYICKECENEKKRNWRKFKKENDKEWHEKEKEYKKNYDKEYYKKNKVKKRTQNKEWYEIHKELCKEYNEQYYKTNKNFIKEQHKKYYESKKEYFLNLNKEYRKIKKKENMNNIAKLLGELNPILNELPLYGYIYKFENIKTGHVYIGQTTKPLNQRYKGGITKAWIKERLEKDNQKFKEDLVDTEEFTVEIIDVGCCFYHLNILETYYINYYNSYIDGYNNTPGNYITNDGLEEFNLILKEHNLQLKEKRLIKII
jgi:hypothetical protein